jgi:hypothetical protein
MTHTVNKPSYKDLPNYNITAKMWELYVAYPNKHIYMSKKEGKWSHVSSTITNYKLQKHLDGNGAYGVFSHSHWTKFICFDVDMNEDSEYFTRKLVSVLSEDFNISLDDIHVSFSGMKGYHCELFFDRGIPLEASKLFHDLVLARMIEEHNAILGMDLPHPKETIERLKAYDLTKKIERRPKPVTEYGLKLPLGKHQKTGKRCWYVDTISLAPIRTFDHILTIEPMSADDFLEEVGFDNKDELKKKTRALTEAQKEQHEYVTSATNIKGRSKEQSKQIALDFLTTRELGSMKRHHMTLLLAIYMNEENVSIDGAIDTIEEAMTEAYETQRGLFSSDTTQEYMVDEIKRLVRLAKERDYRFKDLNQEVQLSKSELLTILSVKDFTQKALLYAMAIHSKRKAKPDGTFYMAYSVITSMTGLVERSNILKHLISLEKQGLIKIVSRGVVDKAKSQAYGQTLCETNMYKVTLVAEEGLEEEVMFNIKPTETPSFGEMIKVAFPTYKEAAKELKNVVSRSYLYNTIKPLYKAN